MNIAHNRIYSYTERVYDSDGFQMRSDTENRQILASRIELMLKRMEFDANNGLLHSEELWNALIMQLKDLKDAIEQVKIETEK